MNIKPITAKNSEIINVKEWKDLAQVCANNFETLRGTHNAFVKEINSLKKSLKCAYATIFVIVLWNYATDKRVGILETKYDKLEYQRAYEEEVEKTIEKG